MKSKYIFFLVFLFIVVGIVSKVYLDTLKSKKRIDKFLKEDVFFIDKKINNSKTQQNELKSPEIIEEEDFKITAENKDETEKQNNTYKHISNGNTFQSLTAQILFKSDNNIISKPFIVRTHKNFNKYIFIQDEKFHVYFIRDDGKLIWKKSFNEKIVSEIFEIDYFNNKKTQYLFATTNHIFLIDYNGNRVGKFPFKLNSIQKPKFVNVLDYSNNKDYRFSLITEEGNIYLFNKRMQILPGWNPKSFNRTLIENLIHCRIQKKDYFVLADNKYEIFLIKRNGYSYPHFPKKLDDKIKSFFVVKNKLLKDSKLVVLNENGILNEFDFNGNKELELKIDKLGDEVEIDLLNDQNNSNSYLVIKKTPKELKILDNHNNILLTHNIEINSNTLVKYYKFNNKEIFGFNNIKNKKLFIYNGNHLLNKTPIKASNHYIIQYQNSNSILKVYNCEDNKLEQYTFALEK